uniref:kelch-like protein 12 isoform X2 n=1 Tax=Ciona intestinalis TaxID=7719 RepID=UPI000EF440A7|nr:kelch-like protein 12 isoform X2 [Ciona intestinalis]|eukprot:XP_026692982.1 kelch-like protein 12 isoform X2 [Ciona intestinalis]
MSSERMQWTAPQTCCMFEIMNQMNVSSLLEGKSVSTAKEYNEIRERLEEMGVRKTAEQIRTRFKTLKKQYLKVREINKIKGKKAKTCRYFSELEELYRKHETAQVMVGGLEDQPHSSGLQMNRSSLPDILTPKAQENILNNDNMVVEERDDHYMIFPNKQPATQQRQTYVSMLQQPDDANIPSTSNQVVQEDNHYMNCQQPQVNMQQQPQVNMQQQPQVNMQQQPQVNMQQQPQVNMQQQPQVNMQQQPQVNMQQQTYVSMLQEPDDANIPSTSNQDIQEEKQYMNISAHAAFMQPQGTIIQLASQDVMPSHDDHVMPSHDNNVMPSYDNHVMPSHGNHVMPSHGNHMMHSHDNHVIRYRTNNGSVGKYLNRSRVNGVNCDVTFKLKDGEVFAHKGLLAEHSATFKGKFKHEEGNHEVVEVNGIKSSILDLLFTFIYLQVIDISDKTVCQLYEASDYLQFNDVKKHCVSFFNDALAVGNCLSFSSFAQRYQLLELVEKCDKFIVDNLELVSKELKFMELFVDEAEALIALKQQQDSCQDSIFRTILNWIKHDFKQRQQFIEQLFQLIDVKKLLTAFLEEVVEKSEKWIKRTDYFLDILTPEYIARIKSNLVQAPGGAREEATFEFMIVGGRHGTRKLVQIYDVVGKHLREITSTLYERWGSTSVKINNHVYTAGGDGSNFVECLNLNQVDGDWNEVASMKKQRWRAASAVLNDQMCVAGGWDVGNILSSVELYNPVVNTWTNIAPMKTERCEHALVSYNGRLYTFGGDDGSNRLNSMESFDPREGKWESLKPMNKERNALCGVVYNDKIYAIGGRGLNSVERYNIRTNTWTNVSSLNHERWVLVLVL